MRDDHTYGGPGGELRCQDLVELVTLHLEGGLGDRDRARFAAHLDACEGCRAYLDQMRRTIWLTGQLGPPRLLAEERAQLLALFGALGGQI
ncbi:zf-HC2 domain-containing protein [Oscillochloris sp. ZM17-4]|uniref:zf-HC2 domain-containing protein n=1 Tax=Oscillochloris sp. ZM17-4 TaxID=2866714 RepID=UPI001C72B912|nr:zf-HC2 domain-containing protein [Oscillochloris sp. ZM17-4]MBX0326217.1 zf-HC2 domain-containing protein [Oscillochloris sp. ZM17-4]